MKKIFITFTIFLSVSNLSGQLGKLIADDGWWIDYDNLKMVKVGEKFENAKNFIGEPKKVISIIKEGNDDILETYLYVVRVKSTKNIIGKKPILQLQSQTVMWSEKYNLIFHVKNGILIKMTSE